MGREGHVHHPDPLVSAVDALIGDVSPVARPLRRISEHAGRRESGAVDIDERHLATSRKQDAGSIGRPGWVSVVWVWGVVGWLGRQLPKPRSVAIYNEDPADITERAMD